MHDDDATPGGHAKRARPSAYPARLLRLDSLVTHYLAPLVEIGADARSRLFGRQVSCKSAGLHQLFLHVFLVENLLHLIGDTGDDIRRRAGRRQQAAP